MNQLRANVVQQRTTINGIKLKEKEQSETITKVTVAYTKTCLNNIIIVGKQ
jgi:hypothetical protein